MVYLYVFFSVFFPQGFICGFSVATGAAARLVSGYDSYGNICRQKNAKLESIPNSGMDHTHRKWVECCWMMNTMETLKWGEKILLFVLLQGYLTEYDFYITPVFVFVFQTVHLNHCWPINSPGNKSSCPVKMGHLEVLMSKGMIWEGCSCTLFFH